jgi:hypothetical protein
MSDRAVQKVFAAYHDRLKATKQPLKNLKAIDALVHCRTASMGTSYYACTDQHPGIEVHHSCRNRACYLCAQKKRMEWVEKQKQRLLDVPHFHVIFTLPHEYLSLWRYNESLFAQIIFRASQTTLLTLLADDRHGGLKPGILMALHTWGRQLNLHPHTHCLVTAGGLDRQGNWKALNSFLLPGSVIRTVYRGRLQGLVKEAFESGDLCLPPDMTRDTFWAVYRSLYKKSWSVRIEERYEHGKGVLLYLARYCKGGPVNPRQLKRIDAAGIEMSYLDHRDKRVKSQRLRPEEFIRRVLLHVPPQGLHTLRYYGFYAPAAKQDYRRCRKACGTLAMVRPTEDCSSTVYYCSTCGGASRLTSRCWPSRGKGNSINRASVLHHRAGGSVQRADEQYLEKSSYDSS